jgi:hypothetical protein
MPRLRGASAFALPITSPQLNLEYQVWHAYRMARQKKGRSNWRAANGLLAMPV